MADLPSPPPASPSTATGVDLPAYFARIGFEGVPAADLSTLQKSHLGHVTNIPFENLDVLFGKEIRLDLPSLQAKLVTGGRGGYCFEHNTLLAAVLEKLGFQVVRLAARVRLGTDRLLPRTHMALTVRVDQEWWLADVGFGGWGLLEPIPLIAGIDRQQGVWTFHLRREGPLWVLECPQCRLGVEQYAFSLEPQIQEDYEPLNFYTSRHPSSRFLHTLTAQRSFPEARCLLFNRDLLMIGADKLMKKVFATDEELRAGLAEWFGIMLPQDTPFPPLSG